MATVTRWTVDAGATAKDIVAAANELVSQAFLTTRH